MPYQKPILGLFAGIYCLSLGIAALVQNRKSVKNQTFALFNFSNAIWNFNDLIIFLPLQSSLIWIHRAGSMGAILLIPFVVDFIYRICGIRHHNSFKKIINGLYFSAGILMILNLTGLIFKDVQISANSLSGKVEVPGPLHPLLICFLLLGLILAAFPVLPRYKKAIPFLKKQLFYVLLACVIGFFALTFYFLSFVGVNIPLAYYFLQCMASFCLGYAIFQHDLIPVRVALRRGVLFLGLITIIGFILFPSTVLLTNLARLSGPFPFGAVLLFVVGTIFLFSLFSLAYGFFLREFSLFQDHSGSHLTHELKSPLASILSSHEVLTEEVSREKPSSKRILEYSTIIGKNTERLNLLVHQILELGKPEKVGKNELETFQINSIIEETISSMGENKSRISFDSQGIFKLRGSKEGLRQILTNLLSNAVKFSNSGTILVQLRTEESRIILQVEDEGEEINPGILDKIFFPYVKTLDKNSKGSGLGLAIAKKWTEFHGGTIWAEPRKGGARFVASFPAA